MSTTDTKAERKTRIITLTGAPPVKIVEEDWPVVAQAKWWDNEHEFQANRTRSIRVRQHDDGRRIVYGVATSQFRGERGAAGGSLVPALDNEERPDDAATVRAIRAVAEVIEDPQLGDECIAALPATEL